MAIIPQPLLFSWEQVEATSDMDRLRMVVEALPDEALMQVLEDQRKGRRDDYPIQAVWNSILAGIVFEHNSIKRLRRELCRNAELRMVCGFDVFAGEQAVPPPWVYTCFLNFGFEHHFIRGLNKMRLRCGLALAVMLALAVGRIQANQIEHLRSLVRPAA